MVDDQEDSRELLRTWLVMEGFLVETAADGSEALQTIASRPVSVVLTDMWMPTMTGAQLVAAIRGLPECASLPVILMSAAWKTKPDDIAADAFLAKPFSLPVLLDVLKSKFGCVATTTTSSVTG